MKELALNTFGVGGPAAVLVQLMLIAVVGWLLSAIASSARQGKVANYINIVTVFVSLYLVVQTVWKAIQAVAGIAGLN